MRTFEVVFKAGYEIEASNKKEAVEEAEREFQEELFHTGGQRFAVDVDGEPRGDEKMKKHYCPECGSEKDTFFVEGGTDWSTERRYICKKCRIGFSVGTGELAEEYLDATGE